MKDMVDIIIPLRVIPASLAISIEISGRVVVVLENKMDVPRVSERFSDSFGNLGKNVGDGVVNNRVHRIKAQTVEVILLQPIKCIVNKEVANKSTSATIEVNRITPGSSMAVGKEFRGILAQVVSFRTKVVVDDIQKYHQPYLVGCLDQVLKILGSAVRTIGCVRQNAVVAPVSLSGKIGNWHEFKSSDSQLREIIQLLLK